MIINTSKTEMKLKPIINSLLDQDAYKYSMGQTIFHQHNGKQATWAFKCRNAGVKFSPKEVEEIKAQVEHYCDLRYTEDELKSLQEKLPWLHKDYIDFLRFWHPRMEDIKITTDAECGLRIRINGSALNVSPYETPIMAIVTETHYKMSRNYGEMLDEFKANVEANIEGLKSGKYDVGVFSEFGFRRRLSFEAQDYFVRRMVEEKIKGFVGTSDVYLAVKYGTKAIGSVAHEFIMLCGQGYPERNPAYSNQYAMESWVKEYGILNGIALTDTIGTDVFLQDFRLTFCTLFSGVRHDSGDPYLWGEKMIKHYESYGIDPKTKTLLFSDSLDLTRATDLYHHFKDRVKVAFGIGTALVGPVHDALNIVIKPVQFDGQPVAKLSDAPGKGMCEDQVYVDYLRRAVDWRMCNLKV